MKKFHGFAALILIIAMMLSSCSLIPGSNDTGNESGDGILNGGNMGFEDIIGGNDSNNTPGNDSSNESSGNDSSNESSGNKIDALPFPEGIVTNGERPAVIGSIVQTGDGNAYVNGIVSTSQRKAVSTQIKIKQLAGIDKNLVTMEHAFGYSCYVSGYIGNSLYVVQDHGSLGWNKKGIGHKDGTIILEYGENGYFSISTLSENKVIVGNPTDAAVESLWDNSDSYLFGYMVYDEVAKEMKPMYGENNLRFYTAGYFFDGVATVSVKKDE